MSRVENLILYPGGAKGLCYTGVIWDLDNRKVLSNVKNVCGISIGSIVGYLFCLGLDGIEIFSVMLKYDLLKFLNFNPFNILQCHGFFEVSVVEDFLRRVSINRVGTTPTFAEIKKAGINLDIIAYDMDRRESISFSADTHPDMIVIQAIIYSIAIPVVFQKCYYQGRLIIDGGVSLKYVLDKYPPHNTLVIKTRNNPQPVTDIISFILESLQVVTDENSKLLDSYYTHQCVVVDCPFNTTLGVGLTNSQKGIMFIAGYKSSKKIDLKHLQPNSRSNGEKDNVRSDIGELSQLRKDEGSVGSV